MSLKIFGLDLTETKSFIVQDRVPSFATEEERRFGFGKDPKDGTGESHTATFREISAAKDEKGRTLGIYLTGFSPDCPLYKETAFSAAEITSMVKNLQTFIVKPYEKFVGQTGLLAPTNTVWWDQYRYDVYVGKVFNMSLITDRLDLYMACLNGVIVTPLTMKDPELKDIPFKIEDAALVKSDEDKFLLGTLNANKQFTKFISEDLAFANDILKYLGVVKAGTTMDADMATLEFLRIMQNRNAKVPTYKMIEVMEMTNQKERKEQIEWTGRINDLIAKGVILRSNKQLIYDSIPLGATVTDVMIKLSGKDSTFDPIIRNELLEKIQEIRTKAKQ